MTLVELIVSVAILIGIIGFCGVIFNASAKVVGSAEHQARVNSAVRCISAQIRSDFRMANSGGIVVLIQPRMVEGYTSMLMLIAPGKFTSQYTLNSDGSAISANAAIILYYLSRDVHTGRNDVLCRNEFLLSGRSDMPLTLNDLMAAAPSGCINPLTTGDVLGETMQGMQYRFLHYYDHGPGYAHDDFIKPLIGDMANNLHDADYYSINLSPEALDDVATGGVRQLYPFVAAGVEKMELAFWDGKDYLGTNDIDDKMFWVGAEDESDPLLPNLRTVTAPGGTHTPERRVLPSPPNEYIWEHFKSYDDLNAMKISLSFSPRHGDKTLEPANFDIICSFGR